MDVGLAGLAGVVAGGTGELRSATVAALSEEGATLRDGEPDDLDFLVNIVDAGAGTEADPRAAFEVRVMEPMRTMKALAPTLAARGRGRIVNVVAAGDPVTGAAALALSRLFSDRYAGEGVLVNSLAPEPGADPDAVAREVAFLCSERSSHVAGTTGVID